jgi:flagellar hook-length control protein FliK
MVSMAAGSDGRPVLNGRKPQTGEAGDLAEPRLRSLPTAGDRARASEPRRTALAPSPAPTSGPAGAAADQPAGDPAWLEPGEAAPGAAARSEHAASDPARAPAPGRPTPPPPVFQIGVQIAKAAPARIDRLFVQLEPAALGRVEVRLKFHRDDQVSAVIAAERPDTLEALQRDARLLERSLHQAGLRMDGDGLTFLLRREQAHHQPREQTGSAPSAGDVAERVLVAAREPTPGLHWFQGLRTLDIRV